MAIEVISVEDFEKFTAPLLQEVARLREESAYNRILLAEHHWIRRETAEQILDVEDDTLRKNRGKWNIRYRKGKRFIDYWLPDIWKYLKETKRMKTEAIERRIQEAIHSQEAVAA